MHKLSRPKTIITYKPRCQIAGIQRGRNIQVDGAKKPEGESARHMERTSQGANQPRDEWARGRISQWANKPGVKELAKGRKSHTPISVIKWTVELSW